MNPLSSKKRSFLLYAEIIFLGLRSSVLSVSSVKTNRKKPQFGISLSASHKTSPFHILFRQPYSQVTKNFLEVLSVIIYGFPWPFSGQTMRFFFMQFRTHISGNLPYTINAESSAAMSFICEKLSSKERVVSAAPVLRRTSAVKELNTFSPKSVATSKPRFRHIYICPTLFTRTLFMPCSFAFFKSSFIATASSSENICGSHAPTFSGIFSTARSNALPPACVIGSQTKSAPQSAALSVALRKSASVI